MSDASASLFTKLQDAPFYRDLHAQAVAMVPWFERATWLDVGCGPGLVARLAAERGFRAIGLDADPAMIDAARAIGPSTISYEVIPLAQLTFMRIQADVVSACSLLTVMPDRPSALRSLLSSSTQNGVVLLVEASANLTVWNALRAIVSGKIAKGNRQLLLLWAATRRKCRLVTEDELKNGGQIIWSAPLLHGLATAYLVKRLPR